MKLSTLLVGIASILFLVAASERTYMGHQVVDKEFPIDGGKTKWLPVTEAGPIPAETQAFKVEVAGISLQRSILSPRQAALAWQFALTVKTSNTLEHVVVEEVYPSSVARVVVDDHSPSFREGRTWSGSSPSIEPSPNSTAWLFNDNDSVFVFRFTITPAGGPDVVLYQPSWISRPTKELTRQAVLKIHDGK
jgi:hypothetical protein